MVMASAKAAAVAACASGGSAAICVGVIPGRHRATQQLADPVGEQGAEEGHAHRAAHGPEERDRGGGDPQVLGGRLVLDRQHQDLHDHADPGAEQRHVEARLPATGAGVEGRQQVEGDAGQRHAGDGEAPVAPGAADDLAGDDRGDQQPAHQRDQQQARVAGRGAVGHLEERRQVGDGAEHRHAHHEAHRHGDVEGAQAEQAQRDGGLGRAPLHHDERDPGHQRGHGPGPGSPASPRRTPRHPRWSGAPGR